MLVFRKGIILCNYYLESYNGFILLMLWQKQLNVEEVKGKIDENFLIIRKQLKYQIFFLNQK